MIDAMAVSYMLRNETWRKVLFGRSRDIVCKILQRCEWVPSGDELLGPCLVWQGPTSGSRGRGHSYPRMNLDGQTVAVHRVFWQCFHGPLPGKKQLDHLCKQRACIIHCEKVTHKENQKRRDGKCSHRK